MLMIRFTKSHDEQLARAAHFGDDSFGLDTLADKLTPLTPDQAAKALSDGYHLVTGSRPSALILQLMLGQWALETGNGKSIHNYNYGNGKGTSNSQFVQYFRCSEIVNGQEIFYDPPAIECRFAAYKTAADGAVAFVRLLKSRENWWKGLHSGSADGFVNGLATKPYAYFTANVDLYRNVLKERAAKYTDVAKKYAKKSTWTQLILGLALGVAGVVGYRKLKTGRRSQS
jgi:hypothetical protein